jgi:hypothetical protein
MNWNNVATYAAFTFLLGATIAVGFWLGFREPSSGGLERLHGSFWAIDCLEHDTACDGADKFFQKRCKLYGDEPKGKWCEIGAKIAAKK